MPNQTEAWAKVFSPCESISVGPWSLSKIIIIIIGLIYLSEERVIKSQNYRWTSDWWMDGNSLRCIVSLVVAFLLTPTGMHVLDRRIEKERRSFDGNVKNLTSEKQANNLELGRVMQSSKLKILAFTQQGIDFFFQVSTVIKKAPEECGIYFFTSFMQDQKQCQGEKHNSVSFSFGNWDNRLYCGHSLFSNVTSNIMLLFFD